jgi:hypothetical protein
LYSEKYRDANNHLSSKDRRAVMSTLAVASGNVPPAVIAPTLRTSILQTCDNQMHAFLILAASRTTEYGTIKCIYCPSEFAPAFGAAPGPLHNQVYGFIGDVVEGQHPGNYFWPAAAWEVDTIDIRIPTEELVNQTTMNAAVRPSHFGPYQNGDAGTRLIRV